jgi:hypothetical protein
MHPYLTLRASHTLIHTVPVNAGVVKLPKGYRHLYSFLEVIYANTEQA